MYSEKANILHYLKANPNSLREDIYTITGISNHRRTDELLLDMINGGYLKIKTSDLPNLDAFSLTISALELIETEEEKEAAAEMSKALYEIEMSRDKREKRTLLAAFWSLIISAAALGLSIAQYIQQLGLGR